MNFDEWQAEALALIPGSMVYTVDLRRLFKAGLSSAAAIEEARKAGQVHLRGSSGAPKPITYRGKVPRALSGIARTKRRKPLWEKALIEAKCRAAVYAVIVEAETHRLEPDGVAYVREMKAKLLGG